MAEEEEKQPIIVKKIKKGGHGHHGGAWKVAYADFVTAMMAFFLLMWLLNATTEEQKTAISSYFDPTAPKISDTTSGAGGLLMGQSVSEAGQMVSDMAPLINTPTELRNVEIPIDRSEGDSPVEGDIEKSREEREEEAIFDEVQEQIKEALSENPELQQLASNIIIDETPEGLRVQIVDQEGQSMFPSGSAVMFNKMKGLLIELSSIIAGTPNKVSVRGHTDGVPFRGRDNYSNWELSTDRANSSRRVMTEEGSLPPEKVAEVVGKGDKEHLFPDDPDSPKNRRISIILLKKRVSEAMEKAGQSVSGDLRPLSEKSVREPRRSNSVIGF